ncbi:RNA polymerase sigma factor, sigma-70 family [Reichenbachiella faecimaris]|uniref:RNA polymerase sigma factor, sigma-70 family n=1 Tax=Reichenbachiella faecimaris TaxID=692418 RepID=A0A1W2GKT7_REIFA|nr:sigma-70 family RNA polymerase sigma factor [Reichenbachiella faecimaris]SMD37283.1 RNA polymerase sigma factor, sigma-70 family [Reichenbachiella faecimaris]
MSSIHFRSDGSNSKRGSLNESSRQEESSIFDSRSDGEIWREFKNYNESAFIFIYSKYFNVLYQYASQFTHDRELIKDAIQDLFIELRKSRTNLSATNSIKRYLFKSIRRKVLYYKGKRKTIRLSNEVEGYQFSFVFSHEQKLIERQLSDEKLERLNAALTHLTSRQREAVYHFYYEGLSYTDISEVMDLRNVKSARNLIYKALGELKEFF